MEQKLLVENGLEILEAKIDYCHYLAKTTYVVLQIKIWIFQNE